MGWLNGALPDLSLRRDADREEGGREGGRVSRERCCEKRLQAGRSPGSLCDFETRLVDTVSAVFQHTVLLRPVGEAKNSTSCTRGATNS
ncbi:hypothetical protein chiPu_0021582 [Chiloscyllium punctatum]|uniref:Uncharacterized protein n=1 Tax=Chiloscyllium punctatum TaxID=137246 RepID=A0A401RI01_CHIPU|nr:hypothetical protein [Chiloscyllium punctatum]